MEETKVAELPDMSVLINNEIDRLRKKLTLLQDTTLDQLQGITDTVNRIINLNNQVVVAQDTSVNEMKAKIKELQEELDNSRQYAEEA